MISPLVSSRYWDKSQRDPRGIKMGALLAIERDPLTRAKPRRGERG